MTMIAPAEFQLKQMLEILKLKVAKRGIDVACLEVKDPVVNLAVRQAARDAQARHRRRRPARRSSRLLKDSKLKVQAQIQGDKVRVTGKKRDDLQEAIALLRKAELRACRCSSTISGTDRGGSATRRAARSRAAAARCGRPHCDRFPCCIPSVVTTVPSSLTMMASMSSSRL